MTFGAPNIQIGDLVQFSDTESDQRYLTLRSYNAYSKFVVASITLNDNLLLAHFDIDFEQREGAYLTRLVLTERNLHDSDFQPGDVIRKYYDTDDDDMTGLEAEKEYIVDDIFTDEFRKTKYIRIKSAEDGNLICNRAGQYLYLPQRFISLTEIKHLQESKERYVKNSIKWGMFS